MTSSLLEGTSNIRRKRPQMTTITCINKTIKSITIKSGETVEKGQLMIELN